MYDKEFNFSIRIYWTPESKIGYWNECCIWALETFGLPGQKFITHTHEDFMDFIFKNKEDAIHFSLRWL